MNTHRCMLLNPLVYAASALLFWVALPLPACADNLGEDLFKIITKAASARAAPSGNLIVNGSFEEPALAAGRYVLVKTGQSFPGWSVVGAPGNVAPISGAYANSGIHFNAEQGNQWLDMTGLSNSATGVQQTVRTQPGVKYDLVFYVGNVAGGGFGTTSAIEVFVDGQSHGVARNDVSSRGQQRWARVKMELTATKPTMTLAFINRDARNDNSNGLDDVSLMPAPSTTADSDHH